MRERSRAFIVADAAAPSNRILFINAGTCRSRGRDDDESTTDAPLLMPTLNVTDFIHPDM